MLGRSRRSLGHLVNVTLTCVLVLLSVSGCARDELYRQSYMAARYRQAWQERRHFDGKDATVSAAGVLKKADYPLVPELLSEVERVIDDLGTLCPRFRATAIIRSLARKYTVPWNQVELPPATPTYGPRSTACACF